MDKASEAPGARSMCSSCGLGGAHLRIKPGKRFKEGCSSACQQWRPKQEAR